MSWIKQGPVFTVEPRAGYSTHAQVPTPYVFDDFIRMYYAGRKNGRSFPAFFDLSKDLKTILRVKENSIIPPCKPGMFDADGIMPSCVIENNGELWMYYIGWSELKTTARYQNEIGLAVSRDGGETFERMFDGPIIGRSPTEPGLAVMPFVMKENNLFKLWYQSGTGWQKIGDIYEPTYVIKYAESKDGIKWGRYPGESVASVNGTEAFSRPCVMGKDMWFCLRESEDYRGGKGSYSIHHAKSNDDIKFERKQIDIAPGAFGEWDSDMQCYPYVIEVDERLVMFYNGNGFGQSGIGVAVWN